MVKLTNALLLQAHRAAIRHGAMNAQLTKAFNARYGCTYSDVDCDTLIDSLDYGNGPLVTVADCDRDMANAGRPASPLSSETGGVK